MLKLVRSLLTIIISILVLLIVLSLVLNRNLFGSIFSPRETFPGLFPKVEEKSPELRAEKTLRFIEGWRNEEVARYLEQEEAWTAQEFLDFVADEEIINQGLLAHFDFLADKPEDSDLEGYLFPDTYRIFADDLDLYELVYKMLSNFDKQLKPEWREEIKRQGKSIYEIITMASMIEGEAPIDYSNGDNQDAKIVSGIFWNRIASGQALESCASLTYILGVFKPQYSYEDTRTPSPYNTYLHKGLPPGPVNNPGSLAIEAAIYPIETDYYYFLTPKNSKEMIYSKTYEEHKVNKSKYLD